MKTIPDSGKRHYLTIVSVFLIMIALIVGMVGCGPTQYNLTVSSTEGGEVTTPGEGTFTYYAGRTVNLIVEAEGGYGFRKWTGDVNTIADVSAAATTITMNGHYSITANFTVPIEIWDWCDLDSVRDNPSGFYLLMNDLDSTTANYTELASMTANEGKGWQSTGALDHTFIGTFDGQGYEIRDLFINRPDEDFVGLFGCVEPGGVIRDIGVVNASVIGNWGVAGLVGENCGTVSHCYFTGNVTGVDDVGGLVGKNFAAVINSHSTSSVTGTGGSVGGLVGSNEGHVTASYSTGSVTGIRAVGGLVGENTGNVSDSFWDTETSGQSTSDGGIGKTTAEMQNIATFSGVTWDIIAVANPDIRNLSYTWNIVDDETYPFLSWQS